MIGPLRGEVTPTLLTLHHRSESTILWHQTPVLDVRTTCGTYASSKPDRKTIADNCCASTLSLSIIYERSNETAHSVWPYGVQHSFVENSTRFRCMHLTITYVRWCLWSVLEAGLNVRRKSKGYTSQVHPSLKKKPFRHELHVSSHECKRFSMTFFAGIDSPQLQLFTWLAPYPYDSFNRDKITFMMLLDVYRWPYKQRF